jgi:hypothetical protein
VRNVIAVLKDLGAVGAQVMLSREQGERMLGWFGILQASNGQAVRSVLEHRVA